jgi:hypothetical protein
MQNAQARSFSNSEVDIKPLARREKALLKQDTERLGEIIIRESSGPRVITELSSPVHKTLVPFIDCQ